MSRSASELVAEGRVASLDQLASIHSGSTLDGQARGCRVLELRVWDGIDARLLPDRALDISSAWFGGIPLAWLSPVGERAPLPAPQGFDWLDAFGGGLVVTCGLRNVGLPSEGHGLHGRIAHLPARDVAWSRRWDGDHLTLEVTGTVDEVSALGPHLRLERTVCTSTGFGRLEVTDLVTNMGAEPEPAPMLYHVNIGAPVWDGRARIDAPSRRIAARDDGVSHAWVERWRECPVPSEGASEVVLEHDITDGVTRAEAKVAGGPSGLELRVGWDASVMPTLVQWLYPRHGLNALGLEPSTSSVRGRAADRADGRLPVLQPGEQRASSLVISVQRGSPRQEER